MPDFFSIIHQMDLFKDLSIEMLENIFTKEFYTIKAYQKNSVIYLPNETCTTFDIILKGIVSVQGIDDEGNYISITDFHARDVIEEIFCFLMKIIIL
jgi:signal-transduction protein with cAMP-binding, CBS, and nucleotidyltransferase domain